MTIISVDDPGRARGFVSGLELFGRLPDAHAFRPEVARAPTFESDSPQAVAVGSQIAEFDKDVPAALRQRVANCFLLAQLGANKAIMDGGSSTEWYERYVEVLANVGWLVDREAFTERDVSGSASQLHQEIIPVIAAAFAPAAAATTVVMAVLRGLAAMDQDKPWFTLFDRESQRAHANQFQVAYVHAPSDAALRVALACFELDASRSVTQVLFFKFSGSQARLRHFSSHLSANEAVFDAVSGVVHEKVGRYATDFVATIEI